ncbi:prolipoprotein diacylglyceryl transferase [Candidatus Peregrinibacteria bacterium]|nr:prolipoprotein diacylglyceryl transferase [Candidatus Peregrinibacteria bacterium]MBI3816223.1 prolipoprotein diacylglyceryl transferase [Candidatus Peregrinibacteria bacterium]
MLSLLPSRTVALELFGFSVHWYGVMYLLSFIIAIILLPNLQRERNLHLTRDEWLTIVSHAVIGVILGGRLGYVFFYEPRFFAQHPFQILAVWNGGMSSHGGFIGVALALGFACWKMKISPRRLADLAVVPSAIGLALGRFGNFINQELYGTVTRLPWGIAIPGVDGLRHPLQMYDMLLSLGIAGICYWHLHRVRPVKPGRTFALFLILYGVMRFFLEYIRDQQYPLIDLGILLTRGQLLTLPLLFIGILLWMWFREVESDQ